MFGTQRANGLVSVLLACALASCSEEPTPYEICKADSTSQCCGDSECGSGQLCDFDYGCGVVGSGKVVCGGGTGTRRCIDRCVTSCAAPGTSCQDHTYFQGGDSARVAKACLPTP